MKKLDRFLKNLGSMVYAKVSELKIIADEVSERYEVIAPGKPPIDSDTETSFQKIFASTLGCISNSTPPETRESLAFWTLISNQDLERWDIVDLMNENEVVANGEEVDNDKLSNYLHEFKKDLEGCIVVGYYNALENSMPNKKAKDLLYIVLKENGHFDIVIKIAERAIQLKKFQSVTYLLNLASYLSQDSREAKQKLLEIYPKAIQELIDEERYGDAFSCYQNVIGLETEAIKLTKTVSKSFIIKIQDTAIEVLKIWNFSKNKIEISFVSIKEGLGKLKQLDVRESNYLESYAFFSETDNNLNTHDRAYKIVFDNFDILCAIDKETISIINNSKTPVKVQVDKELGCYARVGKSEHIIVYR